MNYNDLAIKKKVPIMLGLSSLAVLTIVCLMLLKPLRSSSLEDASLIAQLAAENAGSELAERINAAGSVLRAYSGVIEQMTVSNNIVPEQRREVVLEDLEALLENEKKLTNLWCIFEPNVLDGMDSLYVGRTGSNAEGQFAPWIAGGVVSCASHLKTHDAYRAAKSSGLEQVTKPYDIEHNGRKMTIFSIVIPLLYQGKFLGVIATDFEIFELFRLIENFEGFDEGRLVSNDGVVLVDKDKEDIGTLAGHGRRDIINKFKEGVQFEGFYEFDGVEIYKVCVPIQLTQDAPVSFFCVDILSEKIYDNARTVAFYLIAYCLLGVILIAFCGWLLIRPVLNGISKVTALIHELSLGSTDLKIDEKQSRDEIGVMNLKLQQLVAGIKEKSVFAEGIGKGNLDAEYRELSEKDTLGKSLLDMRSSLQKADREQKARTIEENQRNWGTEGLAKFAEILRSDNDNMETLSYNIISNMVQYLNINQGGIFVLNEAEDSDERLLEMQACYAFDRRKFLENRIRPGEGLVGTCFLEGKPIYMTEVPNEYITITSGLGKANPRAVYICPLKVNDQIYGVVELASFREFEPHELEFVQKVSESIASTIASVRVNVRTSRLLAQTKLQAEEMANTEEELRQNMEEMSATQEETRRREEELQEAMKRMEGVQQAAEEKEIEMKQFQSAVFDTFNIIEFSADGYITNINDGLMKLLGSNDRSIFVGKHSSEFIGEDKFESAWAILTQAKRHEDVVHVPVHGKTIALRQKYVPICSKYGDLLKVLVMVTAENS